jgi:hypothetical protein
VRALDALPLALPLTCTTKTSPPPPPGCKNYNALCAEGSRVAMCANMTGLPALPTSRAVNDEVRWFVLHALDTRAS